MAQALDGLRIRRQTITGGAQPIAIASPIIAGRCVIKNIGNQSQLGSDTVKVHSVDYAADVNNRYFTIDAGFEYALEATLVPSGANLKGGFQPSEISFYLESPTNDTLVVLEWS